MPNHYAKIACSVGKTIRLTDLTDEPLSERLTVLLGRLDQKEHGARQEAQRRQERAKAKARDKCLKT